MEALFDQFADALREVTARQAEASQFSTKDYAYILAAGKVDEAAAAARVIADLLIVQAKRGG